MARPQQDTIMMVKEVLVCYGLPLVSYERAYNIQHMQRKSGTVNKTDFRLNV